MNSFTITPKVDETQEFIEIANDFSNPLDLVREAISNSYDAGASEIHISFEVVKKYGESILKIAIKDNGSGMTQGQLQNFFDLGNSTRREDSDSIGEKGHGTKVYFNSNRIEVRTSCGNTGFLAVMDEPFKKLFDRQIPRVEVENVDEVEKGTEIVIFGYNNNRRDKFTHPILKDYINWFTKHGAIENQFSVSYRKAVLFLKGLGREDFEEIEQGHRFPDDSKDINKLFEDHLTQAPDFYSKKIIKQGFLKNYPEISYQAIFCIEGKYAKYGYNDMLRRRGYSAPEGAYTIQERYGLWLCKDYMPIQRKNEWITHKGSEYTKFHAFINCQEMRLTANRGSVENTPSEVLQDIKDEVKKIYDDVIKSDEWTAMEWLEEEASSYQTTEKEKKNFDWRIKKINRANVAEYKGVQLVEPERESGVFSIFIMLSQLDEKLFPFVVIDYDTHDGIDVIAKGDSTTPIASAKLFYVEFKRTLSKGFNHSFENLHSVVCWDTDIKHDDVLSDINNEERKMQIVAPEDNNDYTRYFLDNPKKAHKIEVFCLKSYLKEKLKIEFRPRPSNAVF
ncbi:ATP-binding protein [Pseudoalteromonas sp. B5MOD-1]|uniref:ATP-binding protein n=1 Tax=Pseudoalteromonas sp. P80D2 TaxID=3113903 RepID=UPI002FCBE65C